MLHPFFLIPLLTAISLSAQEPLVFEHLDSEAGLSHNTTTAILQDDTGYLWIGTIDGLNRYDGYRTKIYKHDPKRSDSLSSNFIHGILQDPSGDLWVGTRDGGLSRLRHQDRHSNRFQRYQHHPDKANSLSSQLVQSFSFDRSGRLWIGTGQGLDRYDPAIDGFIRYQLWPGEGNTVTSIVQDDNHQLWISSFDGLFVLDLNRLDQIDPARAYQQLETIRHDPARPDSIMANFINGMYRDRDGYLWLNILGEGLSRYDPQTGACKHYRPNPPDPASLPISNANVSYQDPSGRLWIGTDGLVILDPSDKMLRYRHQPSRPQSLSNDNVTHIYRSNDGPEGTIWVLTWGGGVNKLVNDPKPISLVQHDPENENSPSRNFVYSLLEDRYGDLWVGTINGGLNLWRRDENRWLRFPHQNTNPNSPGDNVVWCVHERPDGEIWLGTQRGGISRLKRQSRHDPIRFHHIRPDPKRADSLTSANIKVIIEDEQGRPWVGSDGGGIALGKPIDGGRFSWKGYRHRQDDPTSLSNNQLTCMAFDLEGNLWAGTMYGGLNRYAKENLALENGRFDHFRHKEADPASLGSDDVRHLLVTRDGTLWVATYGGGLNRFDGANQFERFTTAQGLANDFVYALLEDLSGHLWLSTNKGINRFDPQTGRFTHYRTEHGLQSDEFNTGACFANAKGELFFGGVNGFNYFHPETLTRKAYPSPVVLTGFESMGAEMPIVPGQALELAHDDKFFSFEMAVLDYRRPSKNRFSYKLEPFDEQWIDNENRSFAGYTNLDPGTYLLRYKGANPTGLWQEGEPLAIHIAPPFYQTNWFRLLMVALLVLAVLLGLKVREFYQAWYGTRYVGHFKLLRKLGKGGSGTVFLARNRLARETVALKVLDPDLENAQDGVRRFLQEAEIGVKLKHPNIVAVYEAGSQGDNRFISMEYLKGQTLKDLIREQGALNQGHICRIAQQVLTGLGIIHDYEIVHRDLKSANIMVVDENRVVIMDFGLARLNTLTTINNRDQLMGTLAYMSPEQTIGKQVDCRSDIYAFGVVLYEMIYGRMPFKADNEMEMIFAIHNEPPPINEEDRGKSLVAVMARCLEKDPKQRYGSTTELQAAITQATDKA